jgi:hypothetical protein
MDNNICLYCDIRPAAEEHGWFQTCIECTFRCTTCDYITPYQSGYAGSSECDDCAMSQSRDLAIEPLVIKTDADMNFKIIGIKPTTQQQGDTTMDKKIVSVIAFDEITSSYNLIGSKTTTDDPAAVLQVINGSETEFDNVIADIINAEIQQAVSMSASKSRAALNRMRRAEHTAIVMRKGEWQSILNGLGMLMNEYSRYAPTSDVAYPTSFASLIKTIEDNLSGELDKVVA